MAASLDQVAASLGLQRRGRRWSPCPVCRAESGGSTDRRGPLAVYGDRWRCHHAGCDAGGDDVALVCAVMHGSCRLPPGDPRWPGVMEAAGRAALDRPVALGRGQHGATSGRGRPQEPAPAPEPVRLPHEEVQALWSRCSPLDELEPTHPAALYLRSKRGLSPAGLAVLDLARLVPLDGPWPGWISRPVRDGLYPLVVPTFDAAGELRALRFRAITERKPKTMAAGEARGLVMADPIGRALLRGELDAVGARWDGQVVICEGEPDWWSWASRPSRAEQVQAKGTAYAVVGVVAGAWTPEIARRIPDQARVIIRTHHDPAGDKYAEAIRTTLSPRCAVLRGPRPPESTHADPR